MTDPVPPADLLSHAAFVRGLAICLLGGTADADDAAQETLARALERPPEVRERGIRPWLAQVLRNVVRKNYRGAARRERRERAVAREEATRGTDDALARDETLRAVVEALGALEAPAREVVMLRHYEQLPPREIAARLGFPVETVRSRLRRAYERLRLRLDERRGGNVEGWRQSLAGLAGLDLLGHGAPPLGKGIAVGAATKVGLAAAAVALLGGGWWFAASRSSSEAPQPSSGAVPLLGQAEPSGHPGLAAKPPASATPTAAMSAAPAAPREIAASPPLGPHEPTVEEVRALRTEIPADAIDGVILDSHGPVVGIQVTAELTAITQAGAARLGKPGTVTTLSGPDGTFRWDQMTGSNYLLWFEANGVTRRRIPIADRPGPTRHRTVLLLGDGVVEGTFYDRAGALAARRAMTLTAGARPMEGGSIALDVVTDDEGRFRFTRLPSGHCSLIGYLTGDPRDQVGDRRETSFVLKLGEAKHVDLGSKEIEHQWTGTLRLSSGSVVRGPGFLYLVDVGHGAGIRVALGPDGKISQRLPPGHFRVDLIHDDARGIPSALSIDMGTDDLAMDLVIPGVRVSGVLRDAATGTPLVVTEPRHVSTVLIEPSAGGEGGRATMAHMDGTFQLLGVLPGKYTVKFAPVPLPDEERTAADLSIEVADKDVEGLVLELRKP